MIDNGAKLTTGDIGLFSCTAAQQNDLDLLKEITRCGGKVTQPKRNGRTALHDAVCEGNLEIVKYLLDQGADTNTKDENGWTAWDLAEHQGHEDIKELCESYKGFKTPPPITIPEDSHGVCFLGKYRSEPVIWPINQDGSSRDGSYGRSRPRRKTNNYSNSLFGIISAAQTGDYNLISPVDKVAIGAPGRTNAARLTVSCPEKGDVGGKLIFLPRSFEELLEICMKKYNFIPAKVLTKNGAEIESVELLRDDDHLIFASDNRIDDTDETAKARLRDCREAT